MNHAIHDILQNRARERTMEPRAIYRCIAEQPLVDNELCQWNPHSTRRTRGLQEYLLQSGWWKPVKGLYAMKRSLRFDLNELKEAVRLYFRKSKQAEHI